MRYFRIPKKVTVGTAYDDKGDLLEMSFALYLDSFVFSWNGWRTRKPLWPHAVPIAEKFRGTFAPRFQERDGKQVCVGGERLLEVGSVVALTDEQHEALTTAMSECEIPPHMTMSFMPFLVALHSAPTEKPAEVAS